MRQEFTAPLLFDGAFGTYYFALTGDGTPCELANLSAPEVVLGIHREYVQAGVGALKTNTFAANPVAIPDPERLRRVLEAGWRLARQAAGDGVRVFADIGGIDDDAAARGYLETVRRFLGLGATDFLFETLASYEELIPALEEIRAAAPDATVIVSFAVSQDGYTKRGLSCQMLAGRAARDSRVDAVGLNCTCGPSHLLALVRGLGRLEKPVSAMPNAGYPSSLNGRILFEDNTDYFAGRLAELYESGADILGGCCGTTPRHIAMGAAAVAAARRPDPPHPSAKEAVYTASGAERAFARPARKLIAVEVDPPLDGDCGFALSAAARLRDAGADLLTLADSPLSRTRADSIMTAAKLRREAGVSVMPHICCRDKNHIALKAGLLGAAMEGIDRVLVITGDPPAQSELRRGAGVFSFNSFDLIAFIHSLNEEVFASRPFAIAGALNVNAANFPAELERARRKLSLGASMLLTQPIFSDEAVEHFLQARRELDCQLFAGILPVAGYKNAVFLVNEVSGIEIPREVVQGLKDKTPAQAAELSIAYSAGIVERVYDAADGFYLMTPLRRVDIVEGLIEKIRRLDKHDPDR